MALNYEAALYVLTDEFDLALYPAMDVLGAAIEQAEGDGGSLTLEQMREHVARQDPNYRDQQQAEGEG
jgi:hypothetical protein